MTDLADPPMLGTVADPPSGAGPAGALRAELRRWLEVALTPEVVRLGRGAPDHEDLAAYRAGTAVWPMPAGPPRPGPRARRP